MNFFLWLSFLGIMPAINSMPKSCKSDRCLKKETNVEVTAVLVPCRPHKSHSSCHARYRKKFLDLDSNGFGEGKMKDCVKKVIVAVSLTNVQHANFQSEYVVVDEVYDCQTGIKEKLLYPYVLKIRRTPLLQTYRLHYEGSVKEKSRIIEGCSYQKKSEKSHCDKPNGNKNTWFDFKNNDEHSKYVKKRKKRETIGTEEDEMKETWRENGYEKMRHHEENQYDFDNDMKIEDGYHPSFEEDKLNEYIDREKRDHLHTGKKELPFGVEGEKDIYSNIELQSEKEKCTCLGEGTHHNTPNSTTLEENLEEETDNMRYNIYKLQEPSLAHNLSIEIFEKHIDIKENIHWNALTDENPIFLCNGNTESWGVNKSCVASYSLREGKSKVFKLPYENIRLLIPQFPHLRGGPKEFLVIPESKFASKEDCPHHGLFGKNITESTSMKHPPIWFRQSDLDKENKGYIGNHFLKYFAKLPDNPLANTTDGFQNLSIYFEGSGVNIINVEIRADFNIILKQHSSAVITEVYVDATNVEKTEITVKVTNSGLVNSVFYVFLTDCPLRLPADFSNIASSSAVISPQQQHIFSISVLFSLPKRRFYCSIDVKNHREDVIAFRRIRFQRRDRCICMWHCSCTCLETDKGLKCKPLPLEHYNAAGFHGGLPMASRYIMSTTFVQEYVTLFISLCMATVIVLLAMGVIKAILGLCFSSIGSFGLRWYLGLPKSIDEYYESNLKKTPEQYDNLKWPIHPYIKQGNRITTMPTEFSINTVFFLLLPLILLHAIVIKLFTPVFTNEKFNILEETPCDCFSDENISPSPDNQ